MKKIFALSVLSNFLFIFYITAFAQKNIPPEILPAAALPDTYIPLLKGKNVAIFSNQTSVVGDRHIIDLLISKGIKVKKIFSPEHGFRGTADAGEKVGNAVDESTGIPLISLYGAKRKPNEEDLKGVDVLVFDIQDVGVRFYTYISSLQDYIESAIQHDKPVIVLDRPNPNGFYVDGPVLDKKYKSFIGMQPIPVVYGMTMGEYAKMLVGEKWLDSLSNKKLQQRKNKNPTAGFSLTVIRCGNYTHKSRYVLPVKPSPNIPDIQSVYWYPSTCFFEGTVLSEGRGTDKPFQLFGHPSLPDSLISFTPRSKEGATNPKLKDQLCYGWDVSGSPDQVFKKVNGRIQLSWLLNAYRLFPDKEKFFLSNNFINRLAGNDELMKQVKEGKTEAQIRSSWLPGLNAFKKIRKKYLLYPDFL